MWTRDSSSGALEHWTLMRHTIDLFSEEYKAGRRAYAEDKARGENPYDWNSVSWKRWDAGWVSGMKD